MLRHLISVYFVINVNILNINLNFFILSGVALSVKHGLPHKPVLGRWDNSFKIELVLVLSKVFGTVVSTFP